MKQLEKIPLEQRIYLDESGINEYLYREYARSMRRTVVFGEVSGRRFGRQSVISALSGGRFLSPMCFEGTCDTQLFNVWLQQELRPLLTPGQVLILDNASFHKSAKSQEIVKLAGCEILFLPPYSPDLNPIEKYWANMKRKVRELLPTIPTLADALDQAVLSM